MFINIFKFFTEVGSLTHLTPLHRASIRAGHAGTFIPSPSISTRNNTRRSRCRHRNFDREHNNYLLSPGVS